MKNVWRHIRNLAGVLLKDRRRYARALAANDDSYLALCNRTERLQAGPDGVGYRCEWQWTSDLHAPKFMPILGRRLMQRALADHPIRRAPNPERMPGNPDVSFIIGHRGMDRLPLLLATLESIAGQKGAAVECLVVEQDVVSRLGGKLPVWVRYIHTPPPTADMPYCRSWAFNIGVKHAGGSVLVLHDNDLLVPDDYAAQILAKVRSGLEVVNLKRFIFYLDELPTTRVLAGKAGLTDAAPLAIMQNSEGGGSIAITRDAYHRIGGMDESFIGWGGEDNEFWERALTLKVWSYGFLPLAHLWHPAQAGKYQPNNQASKHYKTLSETPAEARIGRLQLIDTGRNSGPTGWMA